MDRNELIGIGLYTPFEAQRLIGVSATKIGRWLRGHSVKGRFYEPLWKPQVDLRDGSVYLGFRDLMELRTADNFMEAGVSAQAIRRAIQEARTYVEDERPLSTTKFRTDGRTIFLEIADEEGDTKLLDLFKRHFAFTKIIERSLKDVEFDGITPSRWWIGAKQRVVVDPERVFGQPIEAETGIPTSILAQAAKTEGGVREAARAWCVEPVNVRRAVEFEASLTRRAAWRFFSTTAPHQEWLGLLGAT